MNDEENRRQTLKQAAKEWFEWENKYWNTLTNEEKELVKKFREGLIDTI